MLHERTSEAKERVLRVAEALFSARGYAAVSLQDIAGELHMRKASLYNHAPGGKEELFVAVMERSLHRHRAGIEAAAADAAPDLRSQLRAIATWLLGQPPINLERMSQVDVPAISAARASRLMQLVFESLIQPVEHVVARAALRGEARAEQAGILAGTFVVVVESFRELEQHTGNKKETMVERLLDLLLDGARPR